MRPTLSVLIVAWNSREELARTLPALLPELGEGDELIVVDNDSGDGTPEAVASLAPAARVVRSGRNARLRRRLQRGRRRGEGRAAGHPQPRRGAAARLRRGDPATLARGPRLGRLAGAGRRPAAATAINSAGNPVHFTGIVWAGGHGQPDRRRRRPPVRCRRSPAPAWRSRAAPGRRSAASRSASSSTTRTSTSRCGCGCAGGALGIEPAAVVDHDYEFGAREHKWRWLERNRWAFLIRVYPASLLALLAPALILTELALIPAVDRRRLGQAEARRDAAKWSAGSPACCASGARCRRRRTVSAAEFAAWLTADLDSPFIPAIARSAPVRLALRAYWRVVRLLLLGAGP